MKKTKAHILKQFFGLYTLTLDKALEEVVVTFIDSFVSLVIVRQDLCALNAKNTHASPTALLRDLGENLLWEARVS